ncbi:hypothetical protein K8P94_27370 [Klebsiella pneumoniae]
MRYVRVFLEGTTRLTAVVFEKNQLVKLNFFWVIAGEAFPDVVGQVEIDLSVCASHIPGHSLIFTSRRGRLHTAATIDDAFHIQAIVQSSSGQ